MEIVAPGIKMGDELAVKFSVAGSPSSIVMVAV